MNLRENYLAYLRHENTEWIPNIFTGVAFCGGVNEEFENGPRGGGYDGFGVKWLTSDSANGQAVPACDKFVLRDITEWESVVKLPDLDAIDWKAYAEKQLAGKDRSKSVIEYTSWNSQFLRLTHLMGFENALCAFYEEPEAVKALLSAITDYKIELIERVCEYIKPDTWVNFDDVATERGLFMSPEVYREFIKPGHKKMNSALLAHGVIPQQHCCGKCEEIIPDFIDEGSAAWQAAQPSNDLAGIIEKYGDRIGVTGGYDTQGIPGTPNVSREEIEAEVERCMREYGRFGKSYCFMGLFVGFSGDTTLMDKYIAMNGKAEELKYSFRT